MIRGASSTFVFALLITSALSCSALGPTGDQHAAKGVGLFKDKKYAEAIAEFEKALQKGLSKEKPEDVYACIGNAYREMEQHEKAIEMQKKAVVLGYENASVIQKRINNLKALAESKAESSSTK